MKRSLPFLSAGCVFAFLLSLLLLSACSKQSLNREATSGLASDPYPSAPSKPAKSLRILVWPDTIQPENIAEFERRYRVKLEIETFTNNGDAYAKLIANPDRWDLIMVGRYLSERLRHEGLLRAIPKLNPYIYQYIDTTLINERTDPGMDYFVPFDFATLGIAFNVNYVAGFPRRWEYLTAHSDNPLLYGRISIPDDMRYAFATMLLFAGRDPRSTKPEDIEYAKQLLIQNIKKLGVRLVPDTNTGEQLSRNEILLGITWNAEAASTLKRSGSCRFLLPEGSIIVAVDGFSIPARAANPETAALFLEFMMHPYSSMLVANRTMYPSANLRSMKHVDRFLINGPSCLIPPPAQRLYMDPLGPEELALYEKAWAEVLQVRIDNSQIKLLPLR